MYGGLGLIFSICLDHFLPGALSQGLPLEPRAYQVSQSYQPTCPGDPLSHILPSSPGVTGRLLCSPSICGGSGNLTAGLVLMWLPLYLLIHLPGHQQFCLYFWPWNPEPCALGKFSITKLHPHSSETLSQIRLSTLQKVFWAQVGYRQVLLSHGCHRGPLGVSEEKVLCQ